MDNPREQAKQLTLQLSELTRSLRLTAESVQAYAAALEGECDEKQGTVTDADVVATSDERKRSPPLASDEEGEIGRKRLKKEKDPQMPKRPASSYILYQNDCRRAMKEKNPTMSNTDLLRHISDTWKSLPTPEKQRYEDMAGKLKSEYEIARKKYNALTGKSMTTAEPATSSAPARPVGRTTKLALEAESEDSGSDSRDVAVPANSSVAATPNPNDESDHAAVLYECLPRLSSPSPATDIDEHAKNSRESEVPSRASPQPPSNEGMEEEPALVEDEAPVPLPVRSRARRSIR